MKACLRHTSLIVSLTSDRTLPLDLMAALISAKITHFIHAPAEPVIHAPAEPAANRRLRMLPSEGAGTTMGRFGAPSTP